MDFDEVGIVGGRKLAVHEAHCPANEPQRDSGRVLNGVAVERVAAATRHLLDFAEDAA